MKLLASLIALATSFACATEAPPDSMQPIDTAKIRQQMETIQAGLKWQTGTIQLPGGKAELKLPEGYRYLDEEGAKTVLETLWGNPEGSSTLGMVFGPGQEPLAADGWGAVITYSDDGHVDDEDAAKTDFDEILKNMKESSEENNAERAKAGYSKVHLHGWAEPPHYDAATHKLFWAKDLEFEGSPEHTLNYFVRILGREGVLEINAVSTLAGLANVKAGMAELNTAAEFTAGNRYADFNKDTDRMSKLGVAALVAGGAGVAAKAGLFKWLIALLIAGKKFAIIAFVGLAALIKGWWSKREEKKRAALENEKFDPGA
ncbi:MAG: DUF2167 domain-containing protein [Fibrobacterota bacterium]